jgi:LysR family transcriptional regulator, low CO2-responsive transcriptional regulator
VIAASARRLSVFQCVVDTGGFNAAAMRLGIAQPSVGAHIKALEAQVGQPLFRRQRGSRPQLTRAGEALYAYATEALKRSAEASHTLADLRRAQAREIVVGAHRDVAPHFLSLHLASFARRSPKTRVVTRIGTIEEVLALVRADAVDLGLFLASAPVAGLRTEVLTSEPLAVVVAPGHPLAGRKRVTAAELDRQAFVGGLKGSSYARMIEQALRRIGLTRYDVTMEAQESTAVKKIVRHGSGAACLPLCTVEEEIAAGTLVCVDLARPPQPLELRCAFREPLHETAKALVAHLRAAGAGSQVR